VSDRPSAASGYDANAGYRINTTTGLPECVHPFRVRLPAGRYASNGEPAPTQGLPQPRDETADLESWLTTWLRVVTNEPTAAPADASP
jgi:hypothetical protein